MAGFILVHSILLVGLAAIATAVAWAMARWRPLMDQPNDRSSHALPTPRGGGLGIVAAAVFGWILFWNAGFASRPVAGAEIGLLVGALIVAAAGLADDRRAQPARLKFGAQALAASVAIALGLDLAHLHVPLLGPIALGPAGPVLAFVWLVGLTNAFNFMDGLDGLAATTATIAAIGLALAAHVLGDGPTAALAWSLAAASAGFLVLNRPPARIFMGDVGSQFLGFAFAGIGLLLARRGAPGVGALIVPLLLLHFLFDTIVTAIARARRGAPLWQAHREHLYQRLNRSGLDHGGVTLWLGVMALLQVVFALGMVAVLPHAPWLAFVPALWLQLVHAWVVARRERAAT
ncbi:MAG: glycosyltransferase family 4 protein [Alphaproteobacteria bacterium]|nr:glycosyltransferase family 4 protein [Alphaproteobacteria bacterium]